MGHCKSWLAWNPYVKPDAAHLRRRIRDRKQLEREMTKEEFCLQLANSLEAPSDVQHAPGAVAVTDWAKWLPIIQTIVKSGMDAYNSPSTGITKWLPFIQTTIKVVLESFAK
jgi:hypothetical protein